MTTKNRDRRTITAVTAVNGVLSFQSQNSNESRQCVLTVEGKPVCIKCDGDTMKILSTGNGEGGMETLLTINIAEKV